MVAQEAKGIEPRPGVVQEGLADEGAGGQPIEEPAPPAKETAFFDKHEDVSHQEVTEKFAPYIAGWVFASVVLLLVFAAISHRPWDPHWVNPYAKETMALPPATIRGILTLSIAYFILLLEYYRFLYPGNLMTFTGHLISGFEIMLGFYFGGKVLQGLAESDKAKTEEITQAAKAQATATVQAAKEKAVAQAHAQEQTASLQLQQLTKQKDQHSPLYAEGAEG